MENRQTVLDIFKGLLIILVVIRHALQNSVSDEGGVLSNIIWAVQMPGFMLISGYLSAKNVKTIKDIGRRVVLSAQRYAMPFFSWFIIIKILLLGYFHRNPIEGLMYILWHVDDSFWFLWVLFILSVAIVFLNYIVCSLKYKMIKAIIYLTICGGILYAVGQLLDFDFLGIKFIILYSAYYLVGWTIKKSENSIIKIWVKTKDWLGFLCLLVFLGVVLNYDLIYQRGFSSWVWRYVAGFSGNIVLFITCDYYHLLLQRLKFEMIGRYTLEIYVSHMFVNNLIGERENTLFSVLGLGNFIVSLLITVTLTSVIILVLKALPITNFLFYGKKAVHD